MSCHKNGYDCRICGRTFCRKALLKRHITVHSGQKDYICSVCGYATSHKSNLDRHKRRHGPKYPEERSLTKYPGMEGTDSEYKAKYPGLEGNSFEYKAISPGSLSASSPPLSKCHAFSIENLVSDDYHAKKRFYPEIQVPQPLFTINCLPEPAGFRPPVYPFKKRHLNARYLFTKRIKCTHSGNEEDKVPPSYMDTFTPPPKMTSPEQLNSRQDLKQRFPLLSSKRLVSSGLYHCPDCHLPFSNQIELSDHLKKVQHMEWGAYPQRPLTLQARPKNNRYSYSETLTTPNSMD